MKIKLDLERVVSVVAFVFLLTALGGGILMNGDPLSIIPYSKVVIITVHAICALLTFITIFRPSTSFQIFILFTESVLTILTSYEMLGILFFYCALAIIMLKELLINKSGVIIPILFVIHVISILLSFTHGWPKTFIALGCTGFVYTFYLWIYSILKAKLSCLIPTNVTENQSIGPKRPGSTIKLSEYNLTERQITFVMDYLNNSSYKELSDRYNVSISTVKKEFSDIFKIFGVSKIEELHMLLMRYVVEK